MNDVCWELFFPPHTAVVLNDIINDLKVEYVDLPPFVPYELSNVKYSQAILMNNQKGLFSIAGFSADFDFSLSVHSLNGIVSCIPIDSDNSSITYVILFQARNRVVLDGFIGYCKNNNLPLKYDESSLKSATILNEQRR